MKDEINLFDPKEYKAHRGHIPKRKINHPLLVFDVVGFSSKMNNETMMEIVGDIQTSVYETLEQDHYWAEKGKHSIKNDLILIPTGDGYGVAINRDTRDDVILNIASRLYARLKKEKLKIRMGIAKGKNIITLDVNDNLNLFGYGIVLATRVCNAANDDQILIHSSFAESLLQEREFPELKKIIEKYTAKHGINFYCYNYYKKGEFGITLDAQK